MVVLVGGAPAGAYPFPDVSFIGHGWGHGRGMGQWGALGDALAQSTYQQILTSAYGSLSAGGSTTVGSLPNGWSDATTQVTVTLTANEGRDVIVTSNAPFSVDGSPLPAGAGARFVLENPGASNLWDVYTSSGGCGGNGNWGPPVATGVPDPVATPGPEPFPSDGNLANEVLQLCELPTNDFVRGSVGGTVNSADQARTVNVLPLGQYVADVTPAESPASWGTLGGPGPQGQAWGFQELEAQAVAARSYVMSTYGGFQGWFGYADACDTTCQSYPGITDENALTDTATTATANAAVLMPGGAVARTEYSSSTGGYSAGGTFAAVPDPGDALCVPGACNPHHTWFASVPVAAIESAYPQIGTLISVGVSQRNGFGDLGGRVLQATLQGTDQSVTVSGDVFAGQFSGYGVQSNWFAVTSQPSGGVGGYWLAGTDGGVFAFGDAGFFGSMGATRLNAPMVGMAATPDGGGYWTVAADGGVFAFGDARFAGSMGGLRLNQAVVAMAATPDGGGYWLVAADGGVFALGDAPYEGSLPGLGLHSAGAALLPTRTGLGYLVVTGDGQVVDFGDAPQFSDPAGSVAGWNGRLVGGATAAG